MLAEFVKGLREKHGQTVPEVAEALGLARATVYSWETGARLPAPEQLGRFLDLMDATDGDRLDAWRFRSATKSTPDDAEVSA